MAVAEGRGTGNGDGVWPLPLWRGPQVISHTMAHILMGKMSRQWQISHTKENIRNEGVFFGGSVVVMRDF